MSFCRIQCHLNSRTFVFWICGSLINLHLLSPRFQISRKYGLGLSCIFGPYLRFELSDSNCIWFSTELSSKNRMNILFGGFSWKELAHFGLLWEQDTTLSLYHVTQSVVRVGSKIGIIRFEDWEDKELRLEPKFLNRGLFRPLNWFNSSLLLYVCCNYNSRIKHWSIDPLIHWSINPPSPLFDIEIKQWK